MLTLVPTLTLPLEQEVEVKRVLSRHRRFLAPGARWDLIFGVDSFFPSAEFVFNLVIKHNLDYLFGGQTALAAALAAANAAAQAETAATAAIQQGLPISTGRFDRKINIFFKDTKLIFLQKF